MDTPLIEFHAADKDWLPQPYPASRAIPEWFKALPSDFRPDQGRNDFTLKQCPPFLDAMAGGYIIPLTGDIHFAMDDSGKLSFESPNHDAGIVWHRMSELAGSPWGNAIVVKFLNPWTIVTPPGYSTLYLPPLNRFELPFEFVAGIVETDRYYLDINFPAACLMKPGTTCTLRRGTPLAQVIPFKRENWQSKIGPADLARQQEQRAQFGSGQYVYRDLMHEKKTYG